MKTLLNVHGANIINDIANGFGNEINSILNGTVKRILGGTLIVAGTIGFFWALGKMRQGERAMLDLVASVISIVSGVVLLFQELSLF